MKPEINYNSKYNFWKISAPQGYVLTQWTESRDISEYIDFPEVIAPENAELSEYECITLEQAKEYRKQRDEAIENNEN